MSGAYLISLATDASDRVPPLRPLIYHEQGRGEVLRRSKAKIERERGWWRDTAGDAKEGREGENEIKQGRKIDILKSRGQRQIMQKYREQTERFSRENMEALA